MSDAFFAPKFIPQTYADRIQRCAVLHPIFGVLLQPKDIEIATFKLLKIWRRTLTSLAGAGWTPREGAIPGTEDMQYARNCRPSFVHCKPQTMLCRLDYICPFCYGRWVREVWEMVDLAFPNRNSLEPPTTLVICENPDDTGRLPRRIELTPDIPEEPSEGFPYWLIERQHTAHSPFLPDPKYQEVAKYIPIRRSVRERESAAPKKRRTPAQRAAAKAAMKHVQQTFTENRTAIHAYLQRLLNDVILRRAETRKLLKPAAMFSHMVVEPYSYCWRFHHRQLFMVPAGYDLGDRLADTRGVVRIHERPTRRTLFDAVIRTCAYPHKLLFRDPAMLALLLQARKGYRLTSTSGLFRNRRTIDEIHRRRNS
jgi:hypothetical protein